MDIDSFLNYINTIITILALIVTIELAINSTKINNFLKKKKLKKIVHDGYNSVFYFNFFWIAPIIYFFVNVLFVVIMSLFVNSNDKNIFTIGIFLLFYSVICWLFYLWINEKFDYNIDLIRSMDKENCYEKYYKHFNIKSGILKKFSSSFILVFILFDISFFIPKINYADIILGISIIIYFLSLLIYFVLQAIDTDKAVVRTAIEITIDYRPLQNYFLRIKVKDDKMFSIDDDSIKIYSKEGSTLYTISKSRLYDITSKYYVEFKFK